MNAARLLAIVAAVAAVAVLAVQGASPYGGPKTLVMLDSFDTLQVRPVFAGGAWSGRKGAGRRWDGMVL